MSAQPPSGRAATGTSAVVQQALRRDVKEQIRVVKEDFGVAEPEMTDVLCECVHPNCTARISMTWPTTSSSAVLTMDFPRVDPGLPMIKVGEFGR